MLGRALAMEWVSRVIFLEAAICVGGNLSAHVGRGYPLSAYKQGIGVSLQPVIILHVSFRAMSTCPVCLERPHEEQAYSAVEKQIVQQPSRLFSINLAKIPPNQVIGDFGRGSSVESESE